MQCIETATCNLKKKLRVSAECSIILYILLSELVLLIVNIHLSAGTERMKVDKYSKLASQLEHVWK